MAKVKPGQRVVLQLDPRIALEAIILNRWERIPKARQQEWLRSLLVQGFRSECLALQGVPEKREPRPATAFTHWLVGGTQSPAAPKTETPVVHAGPPTTEATSKPFAALGKVIG